MGKHRALIISDNHGKLDGIQSILANESFDIIFHCGDYCCNLDDLPRLIYLVKGNCDINAKIPEEVNMNWHGLGILMVHGHHYQVKSSLLRLKYRGDETLSSLILFGHSHNPLCIQDDGKVYVNPGSLSYPRGFPRPTFAVLEWDPVQAGAGTLDVKFFNLSFQEERSLSRSFSMPLENKTS
jgi:putative phosphoesterase